MVKRYIVIQKSHSDMADNDYEFSDKDLKDRKCQIKWAEDVDDISGTVCNGSLIHYRDRDLKCSRCGEVYSLL